MATVGSLAVVLSGMHLMNIQYTIDKGDGEMEMYPFITCLHSVSTHSSFQFDIYSVCQLTRYFVGTSSSVPIAGVSVSRLDQQLRCFLVRARVQESSDPSPIHWKISIQRYYGSQSVCFSVCKQISHTFTYELRGMHGRQVEYHKNDLSLLKLFVSRYFYRPSDTDPHRFVKKQ